MCPNIDYVTFKPGPILIPPPLPQRIYNSAPVRVSLVPPPPLPIVIINIGYGLQVHDERSKSETWAWHREATQYKQWQYDEESQLLADLKYTQGSSSGSMTHTPHVEIIRDVSSCDSKKPGTPSVLMTSEYSALAAGTIVGVDNVQYQMSRAGKWWPRTEGRGGAGAKARFIADKARNNVPPPPPWKKD